MNPSLFFYDFCPCAYFNKQKEADSRLEIERQASMKQFIEEIEVKEQYIFSLEKNVEELEKKLQGAEEQYNEKLEAYMKNSHVENENRQQHVLRLQNHVQELEQKVHNVGTHSIEKVISLQFQNWSLCLLLESYYRFVHFILFFICVYLPNILPFI